MNHQWTVANVHDVQTENGDVIAVGSAVASKELVDAHNRAIEALRREQTDAREAQTDL